MAYYALAAPVMVTETAQSTSVIFSQLRAINSVAELLAAYSFSGSSAEQLMNDAVSAAGVFSPVGLKQRLLADSLLVTGTMLPSARFTLFTNEGVALTEQFSFRSVLSAVLNDGAAVLGID